MPMRKVFLFMMVSLDGYFEGPKHDLSWHNVDAEFNESFAIPQLQQADTLLFGRRTYELMASYWPTKLAHKDDRVVADLMNKTPKFVFSHKLKRVDWQNATLVSHDASGVVRKLKAAKGKDIAIFGSNNLSVSLLDSGLIDELRIMVNPVSIGKGTPLFKGIKKKPKLKLLSSRTFKNGNVLLTYKVS